MITYQIKRLTTKKKRVLYVTSKAPNYYIEELIKSGEYKKLNIKYYSPLWLRFQLVKYFINIKNKRKEFIPESPKANDEISFHNLSLEKNRKGINFKLSTLLLLMWSFLFPFQGNLAGSLYEKYSAGHFIKEKKKLVYAKPNLINKVFHSLFHNYYLTEKDLTIKTDLSIEGILNFKIPEKSDVVLSAFDSLEKQLIVKNIKTSNKLKHKIQLNRFNKLSDDGKYKIQLITKNFATSFEFSKVGEKYIYFMEKKEHFVHLHYLLTHKSIISGNQKRRRLINKIIAPGVIALNLRINKKTAAFGAFAGAMAIAPNLNAQQATVQVIPKDSQTQINLEGVLVNVYDENGNLVDSGTSTSEGVTFGLMTDVENIENKSYISFNGKNIEYILSENSTVEIVLTDMLGRQFELYNNNEGFGKHNFNVNFNNFANGIYVVQAKSKEFAATYIVSKVDNNVYLGKKSNVITRKKINTPNKFSKLDTGRWYKFVAEGGEHFKDSIDAVVSNDMTLNLPMNEEKQIHYELLNNDTDSLDVGYVKVSGDSVFVDGEADISVSYSDTLKFVAGILRNGENFSFLRTKEYLPEDLPDTVRSYVVDFALRDSSGSEISTFNENTMTPYRFKEFAKLIHFNYAAIGAIGSYRSNNGKLPDSIVVVDTAYFYDTNTEGIMEQETIDRIANVYDNWIKPLIGQRDIPIVIRPKTFTGDGSHDFGYVLVVPSGSTNVVGSSAIWRALPATIEFAQATLRSGPPYGDPGDDQGIRVTIQELWSCVFGYNPSVRNVDDIILPNESVIHDAGADRPTLYDYKLVRTTAGQHYENNEPIDNILKLMD